jgi:glycosyltransferase involved in cell wall biosynthesis
LTLIAHVATRFLESGSERSIADVIAALPGPDWEHVLLVGPEHQPDSIRRLCGHIQVEVIAHLLRRPDPIADPRALRELHVVLRSLRPDVLHTIQSKSGILGRAAGRSIGVPVRVHNVVMANFGPGFHPMTSAVYRTAERTAARWTHHFVVNGTDLRDRFIAGGIAGMRRATLIRSSIDTSPFRAAADTGRSAARSRLGLPLEPPIVLFASSLDERKGVRDLAACFGRIRERTPAAHLVIAGEGPLRPVVERELVGRGLTGAATLLGFTSRLPDVMTAADCLLMLSRSEGLATVLLHAMAAGRPFVSTAVDGPAELLRLGASGRIVPMGNWRAAAAAVVEALEQPSPAPLELPEWRPEVVQQRYRDLFAGLAAGRTR